MHQQWPIHEFTYLSPKKCNNTAMGDRIPLALEYWDRNDPHHRDDNSVESFVDFIQRVAECKRRLETRPEKHILLFTHFQFIAAFKWLHSNQEMAAITPQHMADFRNYLFTHQAENARIYEIPL